MSETQPFSASRVLRLAALSLVVLGLAAAPPAVGRALGQTQTITIADTVNDAYETGAGTRSYNGLTYVPAAEYSPATNASYQAGGFRFPGLNAPRKAAIASATLRAYVTSTSYDDMAAVVYGHDTGNAPDFAAEPNILSTVARPRTSAKLPVYRDAMGAGYQDFDVTSIVQEIVDRPDWNAGQAVAIVVVPRVLFCFACQKVTRFSDWTSGANPAQLLVDYTSFDVRLGEHLSGQLPDQIGYGPTAYNDLPLFRFQLTNTTASPVTVNQVVFRLSGVSGIGAADLTDLRVREGFTPAIDVATGGVPAVAAPTGTVTFNTGGSWTIPANSTVFYTLTGDVGGLAYLDTMTIDLGAADVAVASGTVGGLAPSSVTHTLDRILPLVAYSANDLSDTLNDLTLDFSAYDGSTWSPGAVAVQGPATFVGTSCGNCFEELVHKTARTDAQGSRQVVVYQQIDVGTDHVYASVYDGQQWTDGAGGGPGSTVKLNTVNLDRHRRNFDAEFESLSGRLMVAWGVNTDESFDWAVHSGSTWTNPTSPNFASMGNYPESHWFDYVRLAARPRSNQIGIVTIGVNPTATVSGGTYAAIWDGDQNAWIAQTRMGASATQEHRTEAADIEFVHAGPNAGDAVVAYAYGQYVYARVWRGSQASPSWTAQTQVADVASANVTWVRLDADPGSDDLIVAFGDAAGRVTTAVYDGGSRTWGAVLPFVTSTAHGNLVYNRPFDIAWDPASGANNVMLVLSEAGGLKYSLSSNRGGAFDSPVVIDAATDAFWVQLERAPDNKLYLAVHDANDDLKTWVWNGASWTPASTLSTNLAISDGWGYSTLDAHDVEPLALVSFPAPGSGAPSSPTAVRLTSFVASAGDGSVLLEWETGSELDNQGFHLYRGLSADGPWARLTSTMIPGLGSSAVGRAYAWRDKGLRNGVRHHYRLEDVDTASVATLHGPVSAVPEAAPAAPPGGGEGEASGSGGGPEGSPGEAGGESGAGVPGGGAVATCPAWVLAATGTSSVVGCERHGDPEAVSLEVVSLGLRGAVLDLRTGGFWAAREAAGTVRAFVPGFDTPGDPAAAALPVRRALVDAVVGRRARLVSAEALELRAFRGLRPSAVGVPEMSVTREGTARAGRRALEAPRISRGYRPQHVARLAGTVFVGERKSAVVEISPLRFDGDRQQLVLAGRVRVKVAFAGVEPGEAGTGRLGRARPRRSSGSGDVLAQLHTVARGVHAVRFEELFPGRGRALPTSLLRLERQGRAVAFRVEPGGGSFGPGGTLYFFADVVASSTDHASEVAWELVRAPGLEMDVVSAVPGGAPGSASSTGSATFETNRIYQDGLLEAPDVWLWEGMVKGVARTVTVSLAGVDTASPRPARVDVDLQGGTASGVTGEHHARVRIRPAGSTEWTTVGEASFTGKKPHRLSAEVAASVLVNGANEVEVHNLGDTGVASTVFLDKVAVSYPQLGAARRGSFEGTWAEAGAVEVSGFAEAPVVVDVTGARWVVGAEWDGGAVRFRAEAGRRHAVVAPEGLLSPRVARPTPSSLRDASNQADYLLIAPRAFLDAAEPLVVRRASQGLSARAVAFEEIAEVFGHGQPSAEAIRAFLAFAYHSWSRPSPRYVLLLGDATSDPRHFLATSRPSPLPMLRIRTSYLWTASDPLLAAVNGDDVVPDLAIGRLPATTLEEAHRLVDKVIAWEDSGQDLLGPAVLVADDPDAAGDFEADVADIKASFLAGRATRTLEMRALGAVRMRPAIRDALDAGASLVSYVGHGGSASWATENVWNRTDPQTLLAQSRQPLLLTLNCLNGYFVAPNFDSLSDAMVKAEGRGAVAAFSPSGLSLDGPAHQFHRALMAQLTSGAHSRLGDAILAAQAGYAQTGLMPELLAVYHLFGDPALAIR